MKKSEFNQSVGLSIFLSDTVRKDGKSTIYLRVIIERKKREFNLNEYWPQKYFDKAKEAVVARHSNDKDLARVNFVIAEAKGRADKIKLRYFAEDKKLTLDLFEKEFINFTSRDNFMHYWKTKQKDLVADLIITDDTADNHNTSYNRLNEFLGGTEYLPFCDINVNLIRKLNAWIRKTKGLSHNTACTTHKTIRTYMNHALADKFAFDYPYKKFTFKFQDGARQVLEVDELDRLKALYYRNELDDIGQEVLRKFIFSCYTGLRISDSGLVTSDMIIDGKLYINLKKGFNFGKAVDIKLPDVALDIIAGRKGLLFKEIADQTCNRYLKVIAVLAKIKKNLTFHVSRDVFGTHYITLGGDIYNLMLLMGHSDIRTTMIYIKLSEKERDKQMDNFNRRDNESPRNSAGDY